MPGPYPLIIGLHGFAATKLAAFEGAGPGPYHQGFADQGYATVTYSARGQGLSCGVPVSRTPGCEQGWTHLADARYESRDAQHLAGLLADEGVIKPTKIGVTGASYGGGQSLLLATLRDRIMKPDGEFAPWRSPEGTPMEIAAAAPRIGWSDLAYALVPTGRMLDYRKRNRYGRAPGIVKQSYLTGLYAAGETGFYPLPGADPEADIRNWFLELTAGEPYDPAFLKEVIGLFKRYRSAYSLQDALPRARRRTPAPTVIYNSWTDDIMDPAQATRYFTRIHHDFPRAKVGLVFDDEYGHPRGSLTVTPEAADAERQALFDRYLRGDASAEPLEGVITKTQGCNGDPSLGPFETRTWAGQHPGEVRLRSREPQTFDSAGGSTANSTATDPFAGGACPRVGGTDDAGAATYRMKPAEGDGFTMVGAPTIAARIRIGGEHPQIDARLWDVAPGGQQTLVTHGVYRPRKRRRQVFQIYPNGWHFAAGHVAKLELLGRDQPYAQPSTGTFDVIVKRLRLELPVRERTGNGVKPFSPPRP
jgi:predicted acyl esterase